jgi:hypothetical protein
LDHSSIYGFGRNQYIHHGAHVGIDGATVFHFKPDQDGSRRFTHYQAFALRRPSAEDGGQGQASKSRRRSTGRAKKYLWTRPLPMLARASVLAGDTLFFAGPPDIFRSDDPAAAFDGQKGGLLCALSTADGQELAHYPLDSPPVWDGMAAANQALYLATVDGTVQCFRPDR